MKRLPPPLLALTPGKLSEQEALGKFLDCVDRALAGGLEGVLVRETRLSDGIALQLARQLRERLDRIASGPGWLGVHDRVHVALAAGANGVHGGFRSLPIAELARVAGAELSVGLSTHSGDEVGDWNCADYLFHGPVRETASKRGLVAVVGMAGLGNAVQSTDKPIWALGGMRPEDVCAARSAGAKGVAVLAGILTQTDPASAAHGYREAWDSAAN